MNASTSSSASAAADATAAASGADRASAALFPADTPGGASWLAQWQRGMHDMLQQARWPDIPALQAQWRAQAAFGGDLGARLFEAWRQMIDATVRLQRQDCDALFYLAHVLIASDGPGQAGRLLASQVHPAAERWRQWHDHLLDAFAGVQADAAVLAESYVPAARESVATIATELAGLPATGALRPLVH